MATYHAEIIWAREAAPEDFLNNRYSRRHVMRFDGGVELPGSSSPHVVPLPWSEAAAVDPEETFVAALSSCHMLWFLSIAARRGFCVDGYRDAAEGLMARNTAGRLAMTRVTLRPAVRFGDRQPTPDELLAMHHEAHEECFIANSVTADVRCEPVPAGG